jgi:hypothetical protein
MRDPILGGYGINPITDTTNYQVRDARDGVGIDPDGQSLKAGVDRLIQDNCKVIAVLGGLHVHKAINGYKTNQYTFVSMVGGNPANAGPHNRGGENLHTPFSNKDRITRLLTGFRLGASEIALYRDYMFSLNSNYDTAIADDEENDWNNNTAWPGRAGPIVGSTRDFVADFADNGPLSGIRGVIISASPYFLSTLTDQATGMPNTAISQNIALSANAWISRGGTGTSKRYVIYPFQEYLIGGHPAQAKAIGPKLTVALAKLGKKAKDGAIGDPFESASDEDH